MLKSLTLAVAATSVLAMAPGHANEKKIQEGKNVHGIQADVRGTLNFESGWGYFISVKPADKAEQEVRVWLLVTEDKELVERLERLTGKEVIAKGKLGQIPEGVRTSVPPRGVYMSPFEIKGAGVR
jgi:hypothetical protein